MMVLSKISWGVSAQPMIHPWSRALMTSVCSEPKSRAGSPVGAQLGGFCHDACIRADRVGADPLDPRELGRVSGGGAARHDHFFCHVPYLLFISGSRRVFSGGP